MNGTIEMEAEVQGQWNWSTWWPVLEVAGWASAGLLLLIALVVVVVVFAKHRQHSYQARAARALLGASRYRGDQTPSTSAPGSCISSMSGGDAMAGLEVGNPRNMLSMAQSPSVPCYIRFTFPILILACCSLFVLADLSETAQVHVKLLVAGAPSGQWEWSGTMASLTLLQATKDAWESGAKTTAVVLGLLNGGWPFLQTAVLLTVWFLPGCCLSQSTRGWFLRVFAAFGKFGLSFPWIVSIWAAICQLQWRGKHVSANFSMSLERGLFLFLGAAILTNVLGYAANHYHRLSTKAQPSTLPWMPDQRCIGGCSLSLSAYSQNRHWPTIVCPLVAVATAGSSAITAFSVSLTGSSSPLMSDMVDKARVDYVHSYSLLSFGWQFPEISEAEVYCRLLQFFFLTTSLIAPMLLAGVLLTVWVLPLRPKTQNGLLKLAYALDAWVALDVFVTVVAIAAVDFGTMTSYFARQGSMREPCDWMERELSTEACVGADVKLERGFGLLAASAVALLVVPKVVLRACNKAAEQRDQLSGRARASSALAAASLR